LCLFPYSLLNFCKRSIFQLTFGCCAFIGGDKDRFEKEGKPDLKFNGHLKSYFTSIKDEIKMEKGNIEDQIHIPNSQGMSNIRKRILKKFFETL